MKEIWYVRHGETEWNAQRRFQGHLDIPLSPVGIGQAAEPLAQVLGLPIATTPLLREIHVGELAGLTRAEAEARFPSFLAEAAEDPWNARRPGGESMADLARRLQAFLEEVPPGRHLVVTHGGVIRAALKLALDLAGDTWRRFHIQNTSITRILYPENAVLTVADAAHLEVWADWLSDEDLKG